MKRSWAALVFVMVLPSVTAWVYFEALAGTPGEAVGPNAAVLTAYYVGKVVQFAFPILWVVFWEHTRPRLAWPNPRGLTLGVGFGLAVGLLVFGVYYGVLRGSRSLEQTPARLWAKVEEFGVASPTRFLLLATYICLLHSFLEEYYYRWFLFGGLRHHLTTGPAMLVSSLAFLSYHVIVLANYLPTKLVVLFSCCIVVGGLVWAWLYQRTNSLTATWLSHLLIDLALLFVGYDLIFHHPH